MGVKFLAAWTRSFRMTTNNVRPITCPDDFKGIKLRTPGNQMYLTFFNACGASATPMSFSEFLHRSADQHPRRSGEPR